MGQAPAAFASQNQFVAAILKTPVLHNDAPPNYLRACSLRHARLPPNPAPKFELEGGEVTALTLVFYSSVSVWLPPCMAPSAPLALRLKSSSSKRGHGVRWAFAQVEFAISQVNSSRGSPSLFLSRSLPLSMGCSECQTLTAVFLCPQLERRRTSMGPFVAMLRETDRGKTCLLLTLLPV
ncbi:hypothetical protein Q8A67_018390 [Cirrhinus molitorella]|uniref:Uncharacterized protein n=1 Tax=Cirrhinus molitorella TaxID=172907 RepID=A0AA88PG92_9TELE|nr:hypothetical protein Q8A67_018390 [Cirrhinus molitorella]